MLLIDCLTEHIGKWNLITCLELWLKLIKKLFRLFSGLNVLRLIDGATATAKAYGFQEILKKTSESSSITVNSENRTILVFDLGGGTLNVSIVSIAVEYGIFEVKSTSGDQHLGGEDFVSCLLSNFVAEFKAKHSKDISTDQHAFSKLREACECAIKQLSYSTEARYFLFVYKNICSNTHCSQNIHIW